MPQRPSEQPAAVPLNLVNGKGEHGEQSEHVAQMVVAVAAGVLERIHVPGLQGLERLVFDRPSSPGAAHDRPHRCPVERKIGDPRKGCRLSPFARFHVFGHVHLEAEMRVVQRQAAIPIEPLKGPGLAVPPLPGLPRAAGLEPAGRKLAVLRLRAVHEAKVVFHQCLDVRAVRRERILHDDRLHVRVLPAEIGDEPLRGVSLAVVLLRAVIVPDRLRRKRQHLLQVRMHDRRTERPVTVRLRAVPVVFDATVFAFDLLRGVMAGPVNRYKEMAEHAPVVQGPAPLQGPREAR